MKAKKGTPAFRLMEATGDSGADVEVEVLAGDLIDCGDTSDELRKVRPGQTVSAKVSRIKGLVRKAEKYLEPEPAKEDPKKSK